MPAPTPPPRRPAPRKKTSAASGTVAQSKNLINPELAVPTPTAIIQMPVQGPIPLMERLAQFWLFGVAMLGLWGGLFYIAFTQGETNERFLLLGIGGLATASAFLWVVERQRRSEGELAVMHDYLLGMSLFFGAAGMFWLLRWLMSFAADPAGPLGFAWLVDESRPFSDTGWYPSARGVAVHGGAAVLLSAATWWYLKVKETGTGILSWFVAALTPFALLVVGLGPWMDWSNGGVSYEVGVTLVILSIVGMWMALQSNRALIFAIVAVLASFMPILYELFNDGSGSALSLLVFIIFAQGLLAISPQLKGAQKLIEQASLGLVLAVLIAMAWMTGAQFELHLGPVKIAHDHWLAGPTFLWLSLLVGYFGAVMMKRVPWMPIGLAFALMLVPHPGNQITWAVTLLMLPYLLWKKDSRVWVRQTTFICTAFAFLIVDWMTHAENSGDVVFWGSIKSELILVPPLFLLVIGEWARRMNRLSGNAFRAAMVMVALSPSMLVHETTYLPWLFAAYLLWAAYEALRNSGDSLQERKDATITVLTSLGLTSLLAAMGRLEIDSNMVPELSGFNLALAIIAIAYYSLGLSGKVKELDLGHIFAWMTISSARAPVFDPATGQWIAQQPEEEDPEKPVWLQHGWGTMARTTLIGPLLLLGIALAGVDGASLVSEWWWVLFLAIPAGMLIKELLDEESSTSETRAVGVWTMFLIAFPLSIKMHLEEPGLVASTFIFDAILLAGPLSIHLLLEKRGLNNENTNRNADIATLIGLLAIALLDSTGGLVFFPLFAIVAHRTYQHRLLPLAIITPLSLLMFAERPLASGAILMQMLGGTPLEEYLLSRGQMLDFDVARINGWFGAAFAMLMFGRIIQDRRHPPEDDEERIPFVWTGLVMLVSLQAMLVSDAMLPLALTTLMVIIGWFAGRTEFFAVAPFAYFFSFLIAIGDISNELSESEIFSYAALATGFVTMALSWMAREGILYRWSGDSTSLEKYRQVTGKENAGPSIFKAVTDEGRESLQRLLYWSGLLFMFLAFDILYGISTVIAAAWVTYDALRKGEKNAFLAMPVLHAIAFWNVGRHLDTLDIDGLGGWVMLLDGIAFSYLSWKKWYPDWDWSESGEDYWKWNDMLGILGVAYFSVGIWWALLDNSALLVAVVIIFYGGAMVAVDPETQWRRTMGILSSTVGGFIALISGEDQTFSGIVMILAGLAAFIQAASYFQRWGVGFTEISGSKEELQQEEEITTEDVEAAADEEEEIPAIIKSESDWDESSAEDELEITIEEEVKDVEPRLEPDQEDMGILNLSAMSAPCRVRVLELMNGVVDTGQGFKIQLADEVSGNIKRALLSTDFEGYIPKVNFDPMGRAVLSFDEDPLAS